MCVCIYVRMYINSKFASLIMGSHKISSVHINTYEYNHKHHLECIRITEKKLEISDLRKLDSLTITAISTNTYR